MTPNGIKKRFIVTSGGGDNCPVTFTTSVNATLLRATLISSSNIGTEFTVEIEYIGTE